MAVTDAIRIRRLDGDGAARAIPALASVLVDCVDGGASVSFMPPMGAARAERFWARVADAVAVGERALLVAEDADGIAGTVQLLLAMPENQPHRAEVAKMLVHRRARGRGVARRLMLAVEALARDEGRTLLLLDTVTGSIADRLYTCLGWQRVGEVPNFALMPDGSPCSTTFFYKSLG